MKSHLITPIVIAVMLSLATAVGPDAAKAANDGGVQFGNSLAPAGDPCVALVHEQVVNQLKLLGFGRWSEACKIAQAAQKRTGIKSNVEVKP